MSESLTDVIEVLGAAGAELRNVKRLLGDAGENAWDQLLDWLVDDWFRLDVLGLENIPADGPAVVVANHSGAWGLDAFVLQKVFARSLRRPLHIPAAPLVFRFPVIGSYARKNGAIPLDPLLGLEHLNAGELVGVFPEGISGLEKPFRKRYRLRPFSPGFAVTAVRAGAPVVPVSVIGAEEACPRMGRSRPWRVSSASPASRSPRSSRCPRNGSSPSASRSPHRPGPSPSPAAPPRPGGCAPSRRQRCRPWWTGNGASGTPLLVAPPR